MGEKENIVKRVCKELGLTQKELAKYLKIDENLLKNIEARADIAYYLENVLRTKKLPCK